MLRSSLPMAGAIVALLMVSCGQSESVAADQNNPQDVEQSPEPEKEPKAPLDEEERVEAEVMATNIKLDLPRVPEFILPQANPDGSHTISEMRLSGVAYLGQEIRLKGTVLWIYDCATANRTPEMSGDEIKEMLATQPERCTRPHFILGEVGTQAERGIQVVEYPRLLREDEKSFLDDELVAEMEATMAALPAFKPGDEVMVTGMWSLQSPRGFYNSDGLLTYGSMINLTTPAVP